MPSFLIADDSPGKMQFLRSIVEKAKWPGSILEAMTTDDAKDVIDRNPDIRAAFVDYYIPSECGPAVISYLREKVPGVRIALVSSANSEKNAIEARSVGAEAVVCTSKPVDEVTSELLSILEEWRIEEEARGKV